MPNQIVIGKFFPAVARWFAHTALLCLCTLAHADQLIVTTANSDGNAIYDLSLSPTSPPHGRGDLTIFCVTDWPV